MAHWTPRWCAIAHWLEVVATVICAACRGRRMAILPGTALLLGTGRHTGPRDPGGRGAVLVRLASGGSCTLLVTTASQQGSRTSCSTRPEVHLVGATGEVPPSPGPAGTLSRHQSAATSRGSAAVALLGPCETRKCLARSAPPVAWAALCVTMSATAGAAAFEASAASSLPSSSNAAET